MLRKTVLASIPTRASTSTGEIDITTAASVVVSSEEPNHPIDNVFDRHRGPGASEWVAAEPGEQSIVLAFDSAQAIRRIAIEIEEKSAARSQKIQLLISRDHGFTYDSLFQQGFNFSPPATTFEREQWQVELSGITHLQLTIMPDTAGSSCRARLTSLDLW